MPSTVNPSSCYLWFNDQSRYTARHSPTCLLCAPKLLIDNSWLPAVTINLSLLLLSYIIRMVEFLGQQQPVATAFSIAVEVVECKLKCGMPTSEKASFKILGRKVVNDIFPLFQQTDDQSRCCHWILLSFSFTALRLYQHHQIY
jgi:hypothetical protein